MDARDGGGMRVNKASISNDIIRNMENLQTEKVAKNLADASLRKYACVKYRRQLAGGREAVLKDFQVGMFDLAQ